MASAYVFILFGALRRTWWGLAIVLAFWAIAAKAFHAYVLYPWLDMPTHFAGGVAIAWFFSALIEESTDILGPTPVPIRLLSSVALTALAAVVWEFLEFLSDRFFQSHLNLGVSDTLSDLFFGLMGGAVTAIAVGVGGRRTGGGRGRSDTHNR